MTKNHFTTAAEREAAIRGLDVKKHKAVLAYRREQGPEMAVEYPLWEMDGGLIIGLGDYARYRNGTIASTWYGDTPYYVLLAVIPHPLPPLPTAFGSLVAARVDGKRQRLSLADARDHFCWVSEDMEWFSTLALADYTILFDAATIPEEGN